MDENETRSEDQENAGRPGSEQAEGAGKEARKALDDARVALREAAEKVGVAARLVGREVGSGAGEVLEDLKGAARMAGDRARHATADALAWARERVEPAEGQPPAAESRPGAPPPPRAAGGIDANLTAALAYVGWGVTGVLFYIIEPQNRFVRFHALQSILLTAALIVTGVALMVVPFIGPPLLALASVGFVIAWLFAMWKALHYEEYLLPFIGEIARAQVDRRA